MDILSAKQSKTDRLRRRIDRLLSENESLRKENESLKKRISAADELISEYRCLIDEVSAIKERYTCALRDTIEMRKEFMKKFNEHLRSIKKV